MDKQKILVLGGEGMFAKAFDEFKPDWANVIRYGKKDCNITYLDGLSAKFDSDKPYAVINTAAVTNQDWAEDHPRETFDINMMGAINVARLCSEKGIRCVHIDSCFSKEPTNQYAYSKYAAYRYIESAFPGAYIARVGWLFGYAHLTQFDGLIVKVLKTCRKLELTTKHYGSPTYVKDAAEHIYEQIKQEFKGLEEVANQGSCNKYEYGLALAAAIGLEEKAKLLFSETGAFPEKTKKPTDATLDGKMRPWKTAMAEWGRIFSLKQII